MYHGSPHSTQTVTVQFRHMAKIDSLVTSSKNQAQHLESVISGNLRCDVVFDRTHSSHQGPLCHVTIRVHIPGQRIYVAHHTESGESKEALFMCTNVAFGQLRRQLTKNRTKKKNRRSLAKNPSANIAEL